MLIWWSFVKWFPEGSLVDWLYVRLICLLQVAMYWSSVYSRIQLCECVAPSYVIVHLHTEGGSSLFFLLHFCCSHHGWSTSIVSLSCSLSHSSTKMNGRQSGLVWGVIFRLNLLVTADVGLQFDKKDDIPKQHFVGLFVTQSVNQHLFWAKMFRCRFYCKK